MLSQKDSATSIYPITGQHSLFLSSATPIAIDPPCGGSSPCGERYEVTLFRGNDTIASVLPLRRQCCVPMTRGPKAHVPTAERPQASSVPQNLRCLKEFAYAHHATNPSPNHRLDARQVHLCLAGPMPLLRVRVYCPRAFDGSLRSRLTS